MAAGVTSAYNKHGLQTAALVCGVGAWPTRLGEAPPRGPPDAGTTAAVYGVHVACHAQSTYAPPLNPAGQSTRIGSYYHKTGCLQNRVEEGFRQTKASCILTERPLANYGTIRKVGRKLMLDASSAAAAAASTTPREASGSMSARGVSSSSGAAQAVDAMNSTIAPRSARGDRLSSTNPRDVLAEALSQRSRRSSVPSWARANENRHAAWDFKPLPFYEKQSEAIGKHARKAEDYLSKRAAGKSESGFMAPNELIATLTVHHDAHSP